MTDNDIPNIWILPFNENEYYIETNGNTKEESVRYRSYLTVIDNVHILNMQPITAEKNEIVYMGDREYIFVKMSLSDNNILTFWNIENKGFKKNHSEEELFQYVQKNIRNDNVYVQVDRLKENCSSRYRLFTFIAATEQQAEADVSGNVSTTARSLA